MQMMTGISTVDGRVLIVELIDTLRERWILEEMRFEDDRCGIETTHLFDALFDETSTCVGRERSEIFVLVVKCSCRRGEIGHEVLDGVKLESFFERQGELMGEISLSDVCLTVLVVTMHEIREKNPLI